MTRAMAFLPGRAASSGLFAFAESAVAETSFTLMSILRLASEGIVAGLKADNAQAFPRAAFVNTIVGKRCSRRQQTNWPKSRHIFYFCTEPACSTAS